MRKFSNDIIDKIQQKAHTQGNNSQITFGMTLQRSKILPLNEPLFFERVVMPMHPNTSMANDIDISVEHNMLRGLGENTWFSIVRDGICEVYRSEYKHNIEKQTYEKIATMGEAVACCIGHEGQLISTQPDVETILTPYAPFVFWITHLGELMCCDLNTNETIRLIEANCNDVSCVNATRNNLEELDYGFIVCVLVNGTPFTIQYTKEGWHDPQIVSILGEGPFVSIQSVKTWDYRIIITVSDSSGNSKRAYSRYQGLAKRANENFDVELSAVCITRPKTPPSVINIENIPDNANNWGRLVKVVFDQPLRPSIYAENMFTINGNKIRTSIGVTYAGSTVIVEFPDFNDEERYQPLTITYTAADCIINDNSKSIMNTHYIFAENFTTDFVATNLVDPTPITNEYLSSNISVSADIKNKTKQYASDNQNMNVSIGVTCDVKHTNRNSSEYNGTMSASIDVTASIIRTSDI